MVDFNITCDVFAKAKVFRTLTGLFRYLLISTLKEPFLHCIFFNSNLRHPVSDVLGIKNYTSYLILKPPVSRML